MKQSCQVVDEVGLMRVTAIELGGRNGEMSCQLDSGFEADLQKTAFLLSDHESDSVVAEVINVAATLSQVEGLLET